MPFQPGYGVYGYPKAGGNASLAREFYAVRPDETTFTPATLIYQWCGDQWVPVWGQSIQPPDSVTAAYQSFDTSVWVTWTPPVNQFATYWNIRRNGTLIGTVPYGTLSFNDPNPVPGVSTYSVEGSDGVSHGAGRNAAPITINVAPGYVQVSGTSATTLTVSWLVGPGGQPDQWRIWNITDQAWASPLLPGSQLSFVATVVRGNNYSFGVYPFLSGVQGAGLNTSSIGTPPGNPDNVKLSFAQGGFDARNLDLTWTAPSGIVTDYEVETYGSPAVWTPLTTTAALTAHWSGPPRGVNCYMRVRARAPGGVSGYVQDGPMVPR